MCREFNVTGRVQGVFFRASTRQFALRHDINGHAINLSNGSVEVRACGTEGSLEKLREWLASGPPLSNVDCVAERAIDCSAPEGFRTS